MKYGDFPLIFVVASVTFTCCRGFPQLKCTKFPIKPPISLEVGQLISTELLLKPDDCFNGPKSVSEKQTTTTNRFSSLEDLKYYNYFSHAAECPYSVEGFTQAAPVKLVGCHVTPVVVNDTDHCEIIYTVEEDVYDNFAMVSWNKRRNEVIVSFRGTRSERNTIEDLETRPLKSHKIRGGKIHQGFFLAVKILYPKTLSRIITMVEKFKPSKIMFTGHSLGGAIATLTLGIMVAYDEMPKGVEYRLITFGQPRVGNEAVADFLNNLGIEATRVVANGDLVPHVPPVSSSVHNNHFVHFRNEVWINGQEIKFCRSSTYEDGSCSNILDPQYHMLDHLLYFDVQYGDWAVPGSVRQITEALVFKVAGEAQKANKFTCSASPNVTVLGSDNLADIAKVDKENKNSTQVGGEENPQEMKEDYVPFIIREGQENSTTVKDTDSKPKKSKKTSTVRVHGDASFLDDD